MFINGNKKGKQQARQPVIAKDTASSTAYAKILYGLSEGEIAGLADGANSIMLDDTPIVDEGGKANFTDKDGNGIKWQFRAGSNDQEPITGFGGVENETQVNVALRHTRPFVKTFTNPQLSAVRVRLAWQALRTQHQNGDVTGASVAYAIDIQTDGGAYVTILNATVSDKTSARYERAHRIDLPKGSRWSLRIRRITPDSTSDLVSDAMMVSAITQIIDAKLRYPNTAMLALEYDAKTFGHIAKLAVRLKGKIISVPSNYNATTREYTGLWDGTFIQAYSNNPAWVFYDICTQWRYGLGDKLDKAMMDKWRLYALGQYCDEFVDDGKGGKEPRFSVNVYLQSSADAFGVLQSLASLFRAMSFWQGEQIILDADMPKDAVYTFSRSNVIDGVFNYTGTRAKDRHTVAKVAWDNPDNRFKTEYEFVKDETAMAKFGVRVLDINMLGCTSQGQAQRAGLWALLSEQLQTRTVTFKTGLEGFIPQVGQVINIADNLLAGRAISGRVLAIGETLTLDRVAGKVGDTLLVNGSDGTVQKATIEQAELVADNNLLAKHRAVTGANYLLASIPITETIKDGTRVSLLIHAELGADRDKLALYNSSTSINSLLVELPKREDGVYVAEFDWNAGVGDNNVIDIYHGSRRGRRASTLSFVALGYDKPTLKSVLTLAPMPTTQVGNVWAVHSSDLTTMPFCVMSVAQDDAVFTITALQYNAQKFDATDTGARIRQKPITVVAPDVLPAPNFVSITGTDKVEQGQRLTSLVIAWEQIKGAVGYDVLWRKEGEAWQSLPRQSGVSVQIDGVYSGRYIAKVTPINAFDQAGATATSEMVAIAGRQGRPPSLAVLRATGVLFGVSLAWGFAEGSDDTSYTEIEVSDNGQVGTVLGQFAYPTDKHELTGLQGNLRQYYRGRIVDKLGNKSDWSAWAAATTEARAEKVLGLLNGQISQSHLHQSLTTPIGKISTLEQSQQSQLQAINQAVREVGVLRDSQRQTISELQSGQASIQAINNAISTQQSTLSQAINRLNTAQGEQGARLERISQTLNDNNTSTATAIDRLGASWVKEQNTLLAPHTQTTNSDYRLASIPITETLSHGTRVLLTIKADLGADRDKLALYNSSTSINSLLIELPKNDTGIYKAEFDWNTGNGANNVIDIYHGTSRNRASSTIYAVALAYDKVAKLTADVQTLTQATATKDTATASRIDSVQASLGQINTALNDEKTARISADDSLANRISTLSSEHNNTKAALRLIRQSHATAQTATAQQIGTLQTTLNGQTASVQTLQRSVDGLNAQYTVKVDSGGRVAGFGLANQSGVSDFAIRADKFFIAPPDGGRGKAVFTVLSSPQRVNGSVLPAGTYMHGNVIIDGGSININDRFLVDAEGNMTAKSGVFLGSVKAENLSGRIGIENINENVLVPHFKVYYSRLPIQWQLFNEPTNKFMVADPEAINEINAELAKISQELDELGARESVEEPLHFVARRLGLLGQHRRLFDQLDALTNGGIMWQFFDKRFGHILPTLGGVSHIASMHGGNSIGATLYELQVAVKRATVVRQKLVYCDDQLYVYVNEALAFWSSNVSRGERVYDLNLSAGIHKIRYLLNNTGSESGVMLLGDFIDNDNIKFMYY